MVAARDDVEAGLLGSLRLAEQFVRAEALVCKADAVDDIVRLIAARPEDALN
jgi:hypothetical protein